MNDMLSYRTLVKQVARLLKTSRTVLFITGAGISVESGLPTYRGVGGLYSEGLTELDMPIEEVLSGEMMRRHPHITWHYLEQIENAARGFTFNRAHSIIAEMESRMDRVCVLTQNVDGFHQQAGSSNVIDIHGDIRRLLCPACGFRQPQADYSQMRFPPECPECRSIMRPDVVLFGELLDEAKTSHFSSELAKGFDIVFSIGTSSMFPYISSPILSAMRRGVPTVEINPDQTGISRFVQFKIDSGATAALDDIWDQFRGNE